MAFVYMLKCSDGSYYVGSTRASLDARLAEHRTGRYGGYTAFRPPLPPFWSPEFAALPPPPAARPPAQRWGPPQEEAPPDPKTGG